eukprot:4356_1
MFSEVASFPSRILRYLKDVGQVVRENGIMNPGWFILAIRLILYGILMSPMLLFYGFLYARSARILKNLQYGPRRRNYLDVYLPDEAKKDSAVPVVVFWNGGCWIIGWKGFGMGIAMMLQKAGLMVIVPDYTNYPEGNVRDMIGDTRSALLWVFENVESYGGDPHNLTLMGHSAGAHLLLVTVLRNAMKLAYPAGKKDAVPKRLRELAIRPSLAPLKCCGGSRGSFIQEWKFDDTPAWPTKDIRSVMAISGPCDMCHLHANAPLFVSFQKVTESVFLNDLHAFCPVSLAESEHFGDECAEFVPPITILHGPEDKCVPESVSADFYNAMVEKHAATELHLLANTGHTDVILEAPVTNNLTYIRILLSNMTAGMKKKDRARFLAKYKPKPVLPFAYPSVVGYISKAIMPF